jgi:hypothetical protein
MLEVKNQFAKHVVFWVLTLPILATLLLPVFVPPHEFSIDKREIAFFQDTLDVDISKVSRRSEAAFQSLFVDTGIFQNVKSILVSDGGGFMRSSGDGGIASFSSTYHTSLWLLLYRAIWRITAIWPAALAIVIAMGIPALLDGLVVRARKSYTFEFHNPVYFWTASHSLIIVFGIAAILPLLPMAMTPMVIATFTLLLCSSLWITAANFQTGN